MVFLKCVFAEGTPAKHQHNIRKPFCVCVLCLLEQFFLLQLLDWVLRGAAQVMFVNNPLSGLVIFGGLILQNYWWALNGFVGTLFATVSALVMQQNRYGHSLKLTSLQLKVNVFAIEMCVR